jgi:hypothetical protein
VNEKEVNHPAHSMDRTANWRSHGGCFTLAVKIFAATVEALKEKERQGETQFTTKTEVSLPLNGMFFFFFESHSIYDQSQDSSVVFLTL